MDFGEVLSKAWQIIWKHKVLWIFGILASCSGGSSASSNSGWRSSMEQNGWNYQPMINNIPDWQIALIVGIILLAVLFLVVLVIFLSTIGRVGMIRGTVQADRGADRLAFGELFSGSLPYFWRVFGLNLIVGLAFALAVIIVVVPLAISIIGLVCLIPLICLLVPIGWFVSVLTEQANIAIVTENLSLMDGLKRGYEVLRANLGPMIVMWLILVLGVSLVGGLIIGIPIALIVGPAVIGAFSGNETALGGGLLVTGLCLVAYLPVMIVANGILQSFIRSAWTLTYLRLTGKRPAVEVIAQPAG
jgi:hypothetical protein